MTNIRFPDTDVVGCVFSYRGGSYRDNAGQYDDYDHSVNANRLKVYYYRVPEHLQGELHVGDAVLVHCQTGYQLCEVRVINALPGLDIRDLAPVVCKVDLSTWAAQVEHAKKLKAMKATIDREKKRLESMVTYELIAEKNPEFKAMLEAFKQMGGEF